MRELSHMLKAIHASEDGEAAGKKAFQIAEKLESMKLFQAAKLIRDHLHETLTYYDYLDTHWRRIRTNNPLERQIKEVRRRTKVIGAFPDGHSTLMLCAARLRHVAGTTWGIKKYLSMEPFQEHQLGMPHQESVSKTHRNLEHRLHKKAKYYGQYPQLFLINLAIGASCEIIAHHV